MLMAVKVYFFSSAIQALVACVSRSQRDVQGQGQGQGQDQGQGGGISG